MDKKIQFMRRKKGRTGRGEPVDKWVPVGVPVWAEIRGTGRERPENYQEDQFIALQRREFRVYWSKRISAKLRILSIEEGLIYDIEAVNELGRHEGLSIIAVARGD